MAMMGIVFSLGGGGREVVNIRKHESSMALHPINLCQNMLSSSPVLTLTRLNQNETNSFFYKLICLLVYQNLQTTIFIFCVNLTDVFH